MRWCVPLLLAVVLAVSSLRADDSLMHARLAQQMLGPDVWSKVIRIENDARFSRYPHIVHALVFEVADLLWFYTDIDGTQSFSLHRGRLADEKADFGPLLRAIEPRFHSWSVVEDSSPVASGILPNGCFVESIALLRERLARGEAAPHPRLLAYYWGGAGHTVLTFERDGGVEVLDPQQLGGAHLFFGRALSDALDLARKLAGGVVERARWLVLTPPAAWTRRAGMIASAGDDERASLGRRTATIR